MSIRFDVNGRLTFTIELHPRERAFYAMDSRASTIGVFSQWARFQGYRSPMDIDQIGEICLVRTLALDDVESVKVIVGLPRPHPEGDFHWPWDIRGLADEKVRSAYGIDAIQTLWLAPYMIGAYLYTSDEGRSRRLSWLGAADLGFPVTEGLEDLLPGPRDEAGTS